LPLIDHFYFLAAIYDRVITTVQPERLAALLALPVEGPVLDVGGGTGRVAQTLAHAAAQIVVLDESPGMLWQARDKGLVVARGRAERLPFADGTFSRLLMVDAFHHLGHHQGAVTELARVLASGGRLVVEEPNIERSAVKLIALFEKLTLMRSRFFSPAEVAQMFRAADLRVEMVHDGPNFWLVGHKL
jgi:demethylmenaquinone methyltransferase/2-methoxy-6-polyprenyl-1,4-benzoquinol methylase